ncbi:MAG: hypothetical protein AB3N28_09845 [Kordiimonas sp.]
MIKKILFFVGLVTTLISISSISALGAGCYKIGVLAALDDSLHILDEKPEVIGNYRKAFVAAGLCVEFVKLPVRRAEMMLVNGEIDGELFRTILWAERFAQKIVYVPTPVHIDHMMALSLIQNGYSFDSMDDLKPYRVLISDGHRWNEAKLAAKGIKPKTAGTVVRFLELMRRGDVDVALAEKSLIPKLYDLSDIKIEPLEPLTYHIVLRRELAQYVPGLDSALKDLFEEP